MSRGKSRYVGREVGREGRFGVGGRLEVRIAVGKDRIGGLML